MNRLAVWVAQTAVGVTVPTGLTQATVSPLTKIEVSPRLDPYIAAPPLVAMNVVLSLEGMAPAVLIQRCAVCFGIQCAHRASCNPRE